MANLNPHARIQDLKRRRLGMSPPVRRASVLRLFLASPSDVESERNAVERAVKHYNLLPDNPVRIDVVRWEDHATPDWKLPQTAIFESVSFEATNIFVAIFWSRIGTPTGRVDPHTGKEYISGTVEELIQAKKLVELGKLNRIMLYFCNRDLPFPTTDSFAQLGKVIDLRKRLEQPGDDRALFGTYRTVDEFERTFFEDLLRVVPIVNQPSRESKTTTKSASTGTRSRTRSLPSAGELAPKLCDRFRQQVDFGLFFAKGLRECPGRPHVCLLYGEPTEAHESLVERLIRVEVQSKSDTAFGSDVGAIADYRIDWPRGSNFSDLRRQLESALIHAFNPGYLGSDLSAATMASLPAVRRPKVLVLQHDVRLSRWDRATSDLLRWYLAEYWNGLSVDPSRPAILVFLKLICGSETSKGNPRRIKRDMLESLQPYSRVETFGAVNPGDQSTAANETRELQTIVGTSKDGARWILLPELKPVTPEDVFDWFAKHCSLTPEDQRRQLVKEMFSQPGSEKLLRYKSMADIEKELAEIWGSHFH